MSEVGVRKITAGFVFAHGAEDPYHFWSDAHGDLNDGFIGRFARLLGQVACDGIFITFDFAFVWAVLVEDHTKERGLSRAVRADESDAFAPVDGHFRFAEKASSAESFGKFVNREHAGGLEEERPVSKDFGRKLNIW